MFETLTFLDKLVLIGQVFAKIAYNFWPALVIGALTIAGIVHFEQRTR